MTKIYMVFVVLIALCTLSCKKDPTPIPAPPIDTVSRTVLVYLVANNGLSPFAIMNIEGMLQGATSTAMQHGRLLVYYVQRNSKTQELFEVIPSESGKGTRKTLKTYNNTNSLTQQVMRQVIDDTKKLAPAESYGLMLWSHALGWFPNGTKPKSAFRSAEEDLWRRNPNGFMTKTFGDDNGQAMEIPDLAATLEGSKTKFDFIIFDCCFMASIEVLYELRKCATYIISSGAEIMREGFPYANIVGQLLPIKFSPKAVAESFINYYRNDQTISANSGTISYVQTDQLEALALSVKHIYDNKALNTELNINTIQPYENMNTHLFHDLDQYMSGLCTDDLLYNNFKKQLLKTIPYEAHTEKVFSAYGGISLFPMPLSCGVTTYIPRENLETQYGYTTAHSKTAWAKAIGLY